MIGMRKILMMLLLSFTCWGVTRAQDTLAVVSGRVEGKNPVMLVIQRQMGMSQRLLEAKVQGDYRESLTVKEPMIVSLSLGRQTVSNTVFLTPGAKLEVDFSREDKFGGTHAGINNLLSRLFTDEYQPKTSGLKEYSRGYAEALVRAYQGRVEQVEASGLLPEEQKVVQGIAQYQLLRDMYMMIDLSKAFGKAFAAPEVDTDYSDPLLNIDWLPELVFAGDWFPVFQEWLFAQVQTGKIKIGSRESYLNDMAAAIKNEELREAYLLGALWREVLRGNVKDFGERLKKATEIVKSKDGKEQLKAYAERLAESTYPAMEGVDLSDYGFPNEKGDTVYLSDFKGRYVFIDLWSTGCNPCVAEIAYVKRLEQRLASLPLAWVSISLDSNADTWRAFMKQKGMTGVQLLCTRSRKHPFMQRMAVNGIPRFIILDPDGKVWDASSRRPSDPVLGELLQKELK